MITLRLVFSFHVKTWLTDNFEEFVCKVRSDLSDKVLYKSSSKFVET